MITNQKHTEYIQSLMIDVNISLALHRSHHTPTRSSLKRWHGWFVSLSYARLIIDQTGQNYYRNVRTHLN